MGTRKPVQGNCVFCNAFCVYGQEDVEFTKTKAKSIVVFHNSCYKKSCQNNRRLEADIYEKYNN